MAKHYYDITAGKSDSKDIATTSNQAIAKTSANDTIAANSTTTEILTVGGSTTGYVNSPVGGVNDLDWFAVDLVAGDTYIFNTTADGATPISDTTLTLFNAGSTQLAYNDDANGLYSEIVYTATTTGTYYLQVGGFDVNSLGGYALSAAIAPPATSVLPTINWAGQVPGTSNVTNNVINVYFAANGESFDGQTSTGWGAVEQAAAMNAFGQFSDYINVTFNAVTTAAASDFQMVQVASLGGSTLGYFNPPATTNAGVGVFAADGQGWDVAGLAQGGYGFITLIHEIGHGLGLAHPHDTGGGSTIMNGVTVAQGDYGTYNLNQGIFTTMSYNDGWPTGPNGSSPNSGYGWQGTAMALDVAVLQDKYGVNATNNSTNTTYSLSDTNAAGTFYSSIWDTGGIDVISYSGSANANIDLREASLLEELNGGGFVSYVGIIHGGYTIANGAVIENAVGGSGADTLTGNAVANVLTGNAGNDTLEGGGGIDKAVYTGNRIDYTITQNAAGAFVIVDNRATGDGTDTVTNVENFEFADFVVTAANLLNPNNVINGTSGIDTLVGTVGIDEINGLAGNDTIYGQTGDDIIYGGTGFDFLNGQDGNDTIYGDGGNDTIYGLVGDDLLDGGANSDVIAGGVGNDIIFGGTGYDTIYGQDGNDTIYGGSENDSIYGGNNNDTIYGDGGNDFINGGLGDDTIHGGLGDDTIYGLDGNDTINGNDGADRISGQDGNDIINGGLGDDRISGQNGVDTIHGNENNDTIYGGNELGLGDTIYGDDGNDFINAQDGNDTVFGGTGNDTIYGWNGDDLLNGGIGNDTILGHGGNDTINGDDGDDNIYGQDGNDIINGGLGIDRLLGQNGNDTLDGGIGDDFLYGGNDTDTLYGQGGNDFLNGQFGNDTIYGGTGNDTIYGYWGNDTIYGGTGNDFLSGGGDDDTFIFSDGFGVDVIADFNNIGFETINLAAVTNITNYTDLLNSVTTDSNGFVVIVDGVDTITINNYNLIEMDIADFVFV